MWVPLGSFLRKLADASQTRPQPQRGQQNNAGNRGPHTFRGVKLTDEEILTLGKLSFHSGFDYACTEVMSQLDQVLSTFAGQLDPRTGEVLNALRNWVEPWMLGAG